MSSSDIEDERWERHQEMLRSEKRVNSLTESFKEIAPTLEEARKAWSKYTGR
jgi:t-SNARE complex subunit (syntaxin)